MRSMMPPPLPVGARPGGALERPSLWEGGVGSEPRVLLMEAESRKLPEFWSGSCSHRAQV